MTIAQVKASRRRWRQDGRYKSKKGARVGIFANRSQNAAVAKTTKKKSG